MSGQPRAMELHAAPPVPPPSMVVFSERSVYVPRRGLPQGDSLSSVAAHLLRPLSELTFGAVLGGIFPDSGEDVDPEQMYYCVSRSREHLGSVEEMILLSGPTHYHTMSRL